MAAPKKKLEERRVFDFVYADRLLDDLVSYENPDFLVRLTPQVPYFGVEITDYYASETDARLDRIREYSIDLLDGAPFRHRDDARRIEVGKVDIFNPDGSVQATDVPAIVQAVPPPASCASQVAERITAKGKRVTASVAEMSHINLVIDDRSGLLRTISKDDFFKVYFVDELVDALRTSPFREVFLVTVIEGDHVYVRLKMLYLLSEVFMFNGALVQTGIASTMSKDVDQIELFASYFNDIVQPHVVVHRSSAGTEVIFGDSGVLVLNDDSLSVRLHCDNPISSDAKEVALNWKSIIGNEFGHELRRFKGSNVFSTSAFFPIFKRSK